METDDLIERIAQDGAPITRVSHPVRSGLAWGTGALVYFGLLVAARALMGQEPALDAPGWLLFAQLAAAITALGAAVAAFTMVIPGASRRVLAWPAAAAVIWVGTLMVASIREPSFAGPEAQREWLCVAMIVLGSALPVIAMVRALRRGAPLSPGLTLSLSVLAGASLANVAACVSHPHTSSLVVMSWHGASIALLVVAASWLGRFVLSWPRGALGR
jgi:hypothetical protein